MTTRPELEPWFAPAAPCTPGRAAVIGAGIAGASVSHALRERGWAVTLIDRHGAAAREASGNPVGVVMPRVTADDGIEARVHAAAWRIALACFDAFDDAAIGRARCGVLQVASDDEDATRLERIAANGLLASSQVAFLSAPAASQIAGCEIARPCLHFPQGGTVSPPRLCRALGSDGVLQADVRGFSECGDGVALHDATGAICATADIVVFANAMGAAVAAPWLPLSARRGQITLAPPTPASANLRCVLAGAAYVTPATEGRHCIGATFDWTEADAPQAVRDEDHARNLAALTGMSEGLFADVKRDALDGRAATRCMTPDHLFVAGALPDRDAFLADYAGMRHGQHWRQYPPARHVPGVYLLTGLGARGLVTAPLAADLLACHVTGEPWPIERELMSALNPARFLLRDLKRLRE